MKRKWFELLMVCGMSAALCLTAAAGEENEEDLAFDEEVTIDLDAEGDEIDLSALLGLEDDGSEEDYEYEEDYGYVDEDYDYADGEDYDYADEDYEDEAYVGDIFDEEDLLDEGDENMWYILTYDEEETIELFINDVYLILPKDWEGKYDMLPRKDSVDFYHTVSRAGWLMEDGSEGGLLFRLCRSEDTDYQDLPDYTELGQGSDGYYYYLQFPTDLQAYISKDRPEIEKEYTDLYSSIDSVKEEAFLVSFGFTADESVYEYETETETEAE